MTKPPENKSVVRSQRIFERLLKAYPKRHREEFGEAMAQLFRDQCRDAWRDAGGWGLVRLWLLVLPDLVKTSIGEHLASLKGRGSIMKNLASMLRSNPSAWAVFAMVFIFMFVAVLGTSALVTFLQPNTYTSMARIKTEQGPIGAVGINGGAGAANNGSRDPYFIQTEFEVLRSELILNKVIDDLKLNQAWGKKFNLDGPLKTSESRTLLKTMIELKPTRGATSLVEIRAYSDKPEEAAKIANTVGKAYQEHRKAAAALLLKAGMEESLRRGVVTPPPTFFQVEIIDSAEPSLRAVRPNVPLNLFLGAAGGILAALVAGAAAVGFVLVLKRRVVAQPR